jgi:hypothetical protein
MAFASIETFSGYELFVGVGSESPDFSLSRLFRMVLRLPFLQVVLHSEKLGWKQAMMAKPKVTSVVLTIEGK